MRQRQVAATAQGVTAPLDTAEAKRAIEEFKEAYPGLQIARGERPDPQYLGLFAGWIRAGGPEAENLKQVVAQGDAAQDFAK
eukprot:4514227-Lingulodinium_polyedra.AAC.1